MVKVQINVPFSLEKIYKSGQTFRIKKIGEFYRFVSKDKYLYISNQHQTHTYTISCSQDEWNEFWADYFDLKSDIYLKAEAYKNVNDFTTSAIKFGSGLKILHQNIFETIISFIISQRKSIPAISSCIEKFCTHFGKKVKTQFEEIYLFPTPEEFSKNFNILDLEGLSLGYRDKYVFEFIKGVVDKSINLSLFNILDDDALFTSLKNLKGVGNKVASCIALYAFKRYAIAPVDVWVSRIIDTYFEGINPFTTTFTGVGGVVQQYMFDYVKNNQGILDNPKL